MYVVRAGDTLWKLSQRYGTTVAALARANGIKNPDLIITGQKLTIPGAAPSRSGPSSSASTATPRPQQLSDGFDRPAGAPGTGRILNQMSYPGGAYKCGPTSVAMALGDLLGVDAGGLVQKLSAFAGVDQKKQTYVDDIRRMFVQYGRRSEVRQGADPAWMRKVLSEGGKIIANGNFGLGGHYTYVDAYVPGKGFSLKDPNGGQQKWLTDQQMVRFIKANSNGGHMIAGW